MMCDRHASWCMMHSVMEDWSARGIGFPTGNFNPFLGANDSSEFFPLKWLFVVSSYAQQASCQLIKFSTSHSIASYIIWYTQLQAPWCQSGQRSQNINFFSDQLLLIHDLTLCIFGSGPDTTSIPHYHCMFTILLRVIIVYAFSYAFWMLIRRYLINSTLDNLPGPPSQSFLFGDCF